MLRGGILVYRSPVAHLFGGCCGTLQGPCFGRVVEIPGHLCVGVGYYESKKRMWQCNGDHPGPMYKGWRREI